MAYCDLEDILGSMDEADVIGYTDDDDAGTVDQSRVDQAIEMAGVMIDAYVGGRYQVPLDPVPDLVKRLAVDLAVFEICSRRSDPPENREQKRQQAVRLLEKIGAGSAVIPGAVSAPAESGSNPVQISSADRVFTRDRMRGL